ncbi:MAG: hypothetical protein NT067_06510 [Candidatus Diapherotrites archaeon]|nr:hypothetical protein [Candidatus Diapherotrites archaeon]
MFDKLGNFIPNPANSGGNFATLAVKAEAIKEGINFVFLVRNAFGAIVLGFLLFYFLAIPLELICLFVAFRILVATIVWFVRYKKLRALFSIDSAAEKSFAKILITKEFFGLVESALQFAAAIGSIALAYYLFADIVAARLNIWSAFGPLAKNLSWSLLFAGYLAIIVVDLACKAIRYKLVKGIRTDNVAVTMQDYAIVSEAVSMLKAAPGLIIVILVLFCLDLPLFIPVLFIIGPAIVFAIGIARIRRMQRANLAEPEANKEMPADKIEALPGESVRAAFYGIMSLERRGSAVLGVGKMTNPENSLAITDSRLLFFEVPMPGGNQIVAEAPYSTLNFFWNRGEMKQKGEELLKYNGLEGVLGHTLFTVPFEEIESASLANPMQLEIQTKNKKFRYIFMDREYTEPMKQTLKAALKEKFR